jgi:CRISPR-associated protein Csx10
VVGDDRDVAEIRELLAEGEMWLGGARSAGYGRARLEQVAEAPEWQEAPLVEPQSGNVLTLTLTLLSDTLLRNKEGGWADDLAPELLPQELRGAVKSRVKSFKRLAVVGGFDRTWGLPLDQRNALQAGSVFVFDLERPVTASELAPLLSVGLGERRAEGFGRVAVNWHAQHALLTPPDESVAPTVTQEQPEAPSIVLRGDGERLAREMSERRLRQQLDRRLAVVVQSNACRIYGAPSKAQLARLRTITLNALPARNVQRVAEFLSDSKLKSRAREQYRTARIGEGRLLGWLQERLTQPETIWRIIGAADLKPLKLGNIAADFTPTGDLAHEYTLRLIAAVLHRAAKEQGR